MIKYSFVIVLKETRGIIEKVIPKVLALERDDFEIVLVPDVLTGGQWEKTRQIASGRIGPAGKRNIGAKSALGEIIVFTDDDAYPKQDYLEKLDTIFSNVDIAATGGPAITPLDSKFWERVSGATFLSVLSGGFPERYRPRGKQKYVDDWPTVNLAVRKKIFDEIGGFRVDCWPGEDTVFCLDLLEKKGVKILYYPELIVCHFRREGILKHIDQIGSYGLHRGYFAKRYPKTSLRFKYFLPSIFVLFIVFGGIMAYFSRLFLGLYVFGWGVYLVALGNAFIDINKQEKNILVTLAASYYIFLTHIFYGLRFLQGLIFTRELKIKLRK